MEAIEGLYVRRDDIRFAFIKYHSDFIRKKTDLRNAKPKLGGTYTSSYEVVVGTRLIFPHKEKTRQTK